MILEIKREYLSYGHFSWGILFLEVNNSWNEAILQLTSRLFFSSKLRGERGTGRLAWCWFYKRLPLKSYATNCLNTYDQDWGVLFLKWKLDSHLLQLPLHCRSLLLGAARWTTKINNNNQNKQIPVNWGESDWGLYKMSFHSAENSGILRPKWEKYLTDTRIKKNGSSKGKIHVEYQWQNWYSWEN